MKTFRLFFKIWRQFFREGLIPRRLLHWFRIGKALWAGGPGYFFLLEMAAIRFPHREAVIDEFGVLTFRQLLEEAEGLAICLRERYEIGPGAKVGLIFSNHRGFILSLAAVTRLGADVMPLPPRLGKAQWESLLQGRRVDLLIHEAEVSHELDFFPSKMEWHPGTHSRGRLPRVTRPGQLVVLTSGTTGVSKGIRRNPKLEEVLPVTWGPSPCPFFSAPRFDWPGDSTLRPCFLARGPRHRFWSPFPPFCGAGCRNRAMCRP